MDHLTEGGLLIITLPEQGAVGPLPSHYFDPRAKQGKIRDALVRWFSLWGIPLSGSTHNPTWLEAHTTKLYGAILSQAICTVRRPFAICSTCRPHCRSHRKVPTESYSCLKCLSLRGDGNRGFISKDFCSDR